LNGSGKSTLLKVIAGLDKVLPARWYFLRVTVGMLGTRASARSYKICKRSGRRRCAGSGRLLKEFEEINLAFAEPDADFEN
jgi:ATPase subunit of ABC transporter with duplicated ATPase domains